MAFIELKNITKCYYNQDSSGLVAVNDVSLNIDKGDIYGIIGFSGAGKSTLVRLINRLEEATSGEIIVNGKNILKYSKQELMKYRSKVGMIFQNFNLMNSRNVYKNISFPLEILNWDEKNIENRVNELLELVDLKDKKYFTISQLSGGQKQRVAIARALANNPEILLSDEATSALDPNTTKTILDLLLSINKKLGITIVLITHQMEAIKRICNKVAIMSKGKIYEQGKCEDLFLHPKQKISKSLLSTSYDELIKSKNENNLQLKINFKGEQVYFPYISKLVQEFNTNINIFGASIEKLRDLSIGYLLVDISSKDSDKILKWLTDNKIEYEVLNV